MINLSIKVKGEASTVSEKEIVDEGFLLSKDNPELASLINKAYEKYISDLPIEEKPEAPCIDLVVRWRLQG